MQIIGMHFNYYLICHRKLWLFANGITMENTSDLVYEGKLLHEISYPRRSEKYEEIAIDGIKIDFYDAKNKVIHEIKKSDKHEDAHVWQVKYYLYVLEQNGVHGVTGILEYPKLHRTEEVTLTDSDKDEIIKMIANIEAIVHSEQCPERIQKSRCKNCSYFDFCYANES